MNIPETLRSLGNKNLLLAAQAALAGGYVIANGYGKLWDITEKGVGDLVSNVDTEAEKAILDIIREADSLSNLISEESVSDQEKRSSSLWIVDPLDGTASFLYKAGGDKPSVLIAHQQDNVTDVAVVFLPITEEWFYAVKGKGAFNKNGERLVVSTPILLKEAWVDMNHFSDSSFESAVFAKLRMTLRSKVGARLVTSQVPHSAIAMRILDGTSGLAAIIHDNNAEKVKQAIWDVAAPKLIVEEAGGVVINLLGESYDIFKPEPFVIANSSELAHQIV
jgi:myo-inositol-1(or 4)-monophosphatase